MFTQNPNYIVITSGTILRFFFIALAIVAAYMVRDVFFALFFAVIIASALRPAIVWLEEYRIPRLASVIGIYCAIAFLLFFVIYLVVPLIFDELQVFETTFSRIQSEVRAGIEEASGLPLAPLIGESLEALIQNSSAYLQELGGGATKFFATIFGGLLTFILIVVFSFYLTVERQGIDQFLRLVMPIAYEEYALHLWERAQKKLGRWFRGQLLLGAIIGVLTFFGLTILGIPNAFLFAILAAIFELIPVVGPVLAAIPAVVIGFLNSITLGVSTIILYVVIQQIESHVIVPVVMSKSVALSPIIVVGSLVVGMKLGGILGMLLAVPTAAIIAELISDWDKRKRATGR